MRRSFKDAGTAEALDPGAPGEVKIKNGLFHLEHTLREAMTSTSRGRQKESPGFKLEISEQIPEYLPGDAVQIQQMIGPLVERAVKWAGTGAVFLSVRLYDDLLQGSVPLLFSLGDSERGISREEQKRIFESCRQKGTDLFSSAQLIGQLGGSLWFKSKPGRGSAFFFHLELNRDEREAEEVDFRIFLEDYRSDSNVAQQVLQLFIRDVPIRLSSVQKALAQEDTHTLIDTFHSLTSNLSAARLYSLGEVSGDLEKYAVRENFEAIHEKISDFSDKLKDSLTQSRKYLRILRAING